MLSMENITAGYGESMVLREISIQVGEGKVAALLGSNGVGKSTLLKVLVGQIRPQKGRIVYGGNSVDSWTSYQRSLAGMGYVPQGRDIFPFLSVKENLLLGMEARRMKPGDKVDRILELFPALKSVLKRRGGDLSGGQQQILALARVLLTDPKLLVLDEPTEGIQPSIVQEIENAIGRIRQEGKLSVLLVEQFVDFALTHADHFYLMEHGEVSQSGEVTASNREEIKTKIKL